MDGSLVSRQSRRLLFYVTIIPVFRIVNDFFVDRLFQNAKEAHSAAVQRLRLKAAALAEIAKKEGLIYSEIKKLKEGLA